MLLVLLELRLKFQAGLSVPTVKDLHVVSKEHFLRLKSYKEKSHESGLP